MSYGHKKIFDAMKYLVTYLYYSVYEALKMTSIILYTLHIETHALNRNKYWEALLENSEV